MDECIYYVCTYMAQTTHDTGIVASHMSQAIPQNIQTHYIKALINIC
jgi:hypothetical protein